MEKSELITKIKEIEVALASNEYLKMKPEIESEAKKLLEQYKEELKLAEGGNNNGNANAIVSADIKKHIKIYKLSQIGFSNKEIADKVGTNVGHVWNALNDYKKNPQKVKEADAVKV